MAEGEARGRAKGRAETIRQTAQAMKDRGLDINTIIEITGLPVDEVLRL